MPNTRQHNGVADRYNRVISGMTLLVLAEAKLPKMFWLRAMLTSVRVCNLCPTSSNEKRLSPTEMHYGQPSKLSYLCVFGCQAYYLDRGNRRKLDPKGKKSKFIGYNEESKAYLLNDLEARRVVRASSVTFNENISEMNSRLAFQPKKKCKNTGSDGAVSRASDRKGAKDRTEKDYKRKMKQQKTRHDLARTAKKSHKTIPDQELDSPSIRNEKDRK